MDTRRPIVSLNGVRVETLAVVLEEPRRLVLRPLELVPPTPGDAIVEVRWSGVSTGTERLLWDGRMPDFPGMGYPLVPGYEAVGEIVHSPEGSPLGRGARVFVPGSSGFVGARGLFGAAARTVVTPASRLIPVGRGFRDEDACLLALAATALHAVRQDGLPELVIGHGVLGRLAARLVLALGGSAPRVWETNPDRMGGATGYTVIHPDEDTRADYVRACDMSGDPAILDRIVPHLARHGQVTLAGFYSEPVRFAFPPAFMREARIRIAAEWTPEELDTVRQMVSDGRLRLDGLITHRAPAGSAADAYGTAFTDASCLKMILDWSDTE